MRRPVWRHGRIAGSMEVGTLRRRYSSTPSPCARRWRARTLLGRSAKPSAARSLPFQEEEPCQRYSPHTGGPSDALERSDLDLATAATLAVIGGPRKRRGYVS